MRYINLLPLILITPLIACEQKAANKPLETIEQKAGYSFGVDFVRRLQAQSVDLDMDALTRGIDDAANAQTLALSDEEMNQVKTEFQQKLREAMIKKQTEMAATNLEVGKKFLEENGKKEDVVTTESGLQYKILTPGDGPKPTLEDTVVTNYRGTVIDGQVFDSSYERGTPATFPVTGVIKGWTEALQLMKVGAKWQLFIPSDLAYGPSQRSELIQPNSTLIFEIELLEIKPKEEQAKSK